MSKLLSSRTALRILCALFVLTSAVVAGAAPAVSVKAQTSVQQAPIITDTWAVQVSPAADPNQLALQMGAQNLGQIGSLSGYYLFRIPGSNSQVTAAADVFAASSQVLWFQQQVAHQQSTRVFTPPIDPKYLDGSQWHLANANVPAAWAAGFTGTGVTIAVVDDGLQHTHPDLSAQYNAAASWDFNGNDADPAPVKLTGTTADRHGTAVAGVAAANNDGLSCGVGAAYDAGLAGIRLISDPNTDAQAAAALTYAPNTNYIYNNSWGPADDMTEPLVGPGPLTLTALQTGVSSGRNGKGSIYVWSAGNGLQSLDNVNYDGYANSRFAIAVGAVNDLGAQASYSEPGAPMLVTAPSNSPIKLPLFPHDGLAITTTDLAGSNGYDPGDCTSAFGGTSSSAPLVSGVVALMLQANPNLGWRDVQNILARTAAKNDPSDADWFTNGAGLHVNHKYGFGLVDAGAAVAMANPLTYTTLPPEVSFSPGVVNVNQRVPDNDLITGVTSTAVVSRDIKLDHVEVVFNASADPLEPTGGYRGDLKVVLTSPLGTKSVLSEAHSDAGANYTNWKFTTVRDWGESSLGTWTLKVTDEKGAGASILNSWQLNLYGTPNYTFADVPNDHWAWRYIQSIYNAGITAGCGINPLNYCPDSPVTRAQMAVFLLRSNHFGTVYSPAAATGTVFGDVSLGSFANAWIEQLAADGITAGCGNGNYCPNSPITRAQMAVFLLRAKHGKTYSPPAASGTAFSDVPLGSFAAAWIEELALEGVTAGCGGGNYCPNTPVTRAEMAVFLQRTFSLPLP